MRTCPFGLAHIDIPKGDLDASNLVGSSNSIVVQGSEVYPFGTTEGFPRIIDTQGNVVSNSAHDYAECSNKGLCDRKTGMCECLPGFDGTACQRASCPSTANMNSDAIKNFNRAVKDFSSVSGSLGDVGSLITSSRTGSAFTGKAAAGSIAGAQVGECSGVGTCETISDLAFSEYGNTYDLWDKKSTMGCKCDPGYSGADCSEKLCTYGIDPMFTDDATVRITQTTVRFETTSTIDTLSGTYAIKFYDVFGEGFVTRPIHIRGGSKCPEVVAALTSLPNEVIKDVGCSEIADVANHYFEYTLTFVKNPGNLRQLELNKFLDGSVSTVSVSTGTYSSSVYNKVIGEFTDYFPERCEGVTVKVVADFAGTWAASAKPGSIGYLSGLNGPLSSSEVKILKKCLGDSDGNIDNNVDVADWDQGALHEAHTIGSTLESVTMIGAFPHAIKVVPVETSNGYSKLTPGSYHLLWFDENAVDKNFRVSNLNSIAKLPSEATESYVYTTRGIVQQMGWGSSGADKIAENASGGSSSVRIVGYFNKGDNKIYTNYDTSCATHDNSVGDHSFVCVEKGAKLFVVDGCWGSHDTTASSEPIFGGDAMTTCADVSTPSKHSGNIYTVTKVYTVPPADNSDTSPTTTVDVSSDPSLKRYVNTNIIEIDANFPWSGSLMGDPENSNTVGDDTAWSDNTGTVILFHFTPDKADSYEHTSPCSNRGLCDTTSGLCACFKGYTGEDCSIQNVLAK